MNSLDKQIHSRFLEVMYDQVGPGKKFRYKNAFGKAIGMLPQEINWIETGERKLQFRHLVALHKKLGVDLNWLVAGKITTQENGTVNKRIEGIEANLKKLLSKVK